ncbi:MAG: hypothetical protein R3C52_01140 [Hyphomonadaceae bacterium]
MNETEFDRRAAVSQIPKGCWRNAYRSETGWAENPTAIYRWIDRKSYISRTPYPSRELAEEYALRNLQDPDWQGRVEYLGARFFPGS